MEETNTPELVSVVDIQFRPGQKVYFFDPDGITLAQGDRVIIDTARGEEYGVCASGIHRIRQKDVVAPLRKVLRRASAQDERVVAENRAREAKAQSVCIQKIQAHGLDMQLVSAECAFDGSKILFYFTADERVDFRELVKDLAGVFHTRIELRQIGVRDKAKMVGGLGICGRPFCCASFLDDFQPVSIKMAKSQNLSLNPTKISGTCGRLMCCLKYEQEAYEELARVTPRIDSTVQTPDGIGVVLSNAMLRGQCTVQLEDDPDTPRVYACADCQVLQAGRKTRRPARPMSAKSAAAPKVAEKLTDSIEPQEQHEGAHSEPQENRRSERPKKRRKPSEAAAKQGGEHGEKREKYAKNGDKQHKSRPRRPHRERNNKNAEQGENRPAQNERRSQEGKDFVDAHRPPRRRRPRRRPKEDNKSGTPEA